MILIYPHTVGFQLALELLQVLFILFTGYFDGGNKTISGLYVDESSENLVRDYSVMFPELKSKML